MHLTLKANGIELTPEEVHILVIAAQNQGMLVTEFAKVIQRDRTTAIRMMDSLEKLGLIVREQDSNDKRSKRVQLTPDGHQLLHKLMPLGIATERKLVEQISEEEMLTTIGVLLRIQASCIKQISSFGETADENGF